MQNYPSLHIIRDQCIIDWKLKLKVKKIISVFNGDSGWTINPILSSTEPQPMTSDELERTKLQADYDGMFYNYAPKRI